MLVFRNLEVATKEVKLELATELPAKPVVLNDAESAQAIFEAQEFWNYRELLLFLTWRDIKVRYKQTAMGAAWAIIQPLFMMLTFAVFFGIFVGVPTDGMPHLLFFYSGLMPWTFFAGAVSNCSTSLVGSSNLITKVYFPRLIVPAASIGSGFVDLLITCALLFGLAFFYRIPLSASALVFPLLIVQTVVLAFALGAWLSALMVKYRDIRHALPFVLQMWMFLTPIVYPLSIVPEKWRWLMYLNPMTGIVEGVRASMTGRPINLAAAAISVAITLVLLGVTFTQFRRLEKGFADLI
jgi:lipopolysaccharide transport system permease protein